MRAAMLLHKSVEFDSRVRREAGALAAAGHEVTVVELAPVPRGAEALDGFMRLSCLPPAWVRRRLPSPVSRAVMLIYFVAAVVRVRPDIIHAHDAAMLVPGLVGARLTRAQLVYDSHELASSVPYRERAWAWFVTAVERAIVPRCAAVITVSDGIAARLQERYGLADTPTVVRNVSALRPSGRGGLRQRLSLPPEVPIVLHQGAPAPDRGCEVLLDAARRLDGAHLVFLGDPESGYGEQLQAQIDRHGLGERVTLLPSVALDDLLAWTAEADVGVTLLQDTCENHRLALPNKLFEYVAAGVPVVASALPEVQQLVTDYGIGWCVSPADAEALAATIQRALRERADPELRTRLERAGTDLTWEHEQERLLRLYRALTAMEGGGPGPHRPLILQLVRNSVSTDARVLRAARTAQELLGADVLVAGVRSTPALPEADEIEGVRVVRLSPRGTPTLIRRLRPGRAEDAPDAAIRSATSPGSTASAPAGAVAMASRLAASRLGLRARLRRSAAGVSYAFGALALARRERPALVHANDWNTMWAAILIKLRLGCPIVYDSHELWPDRNGRWESRPWLIAAEAIFVRLAETVLTTSPGHADAIAARYRIRRPVVVRNIPEWAAIGPSPSPDRPPVILYIGGVMPGRGLEQMIDALPKLPDVTLLAVGPGSDSYRAELMAQAATADVTDRVELRGAVPSSQIQDQFGSAVVGLCLIQPICRSYELSLPNKLMEYVAGGLPVLASDLPVISRVVAEHGLGEVVPPADPDSIADGVRRLLRPERRETVAERIRGFAAANPWREERKLLAAVYAAATRTR